MRQMVRGESLPSRRSLEGSQVTRPAAPEPAKTLVERLQSYARQLRDSVHIHHSAADLVSEAATALSLAQTEIKGHMRVEDDLKAELAEYQAKHTAIIREADRRYDELIAHDQDNLAELDKAQSRIAELEKALSRARVYVNGFDSEIYSGVPEILAAIDAALKDRA